MSQSINECVHPSEWSRETLHLCEEYRNAGVVGIDLTGAEGHLEEGLWICACVSV